MKILAKMLLGFLGVALICAFIGVFGVQRIGLLDKTVVSMANKTVPSIIYLNTVAKEFRAIRVAIMNMANPRGGYTPGFIEEQFAIVDAGRAVYRPQYELYDKMPKTEEEAALWKAVNDTLTAGAGYTNKTVELAKGVLALSDVNAIAAQYELINAHVYGPDRQVFDTLFSNLDVALAYVTDYYGTKEAERALKVGETAFYTMILVTLMGLVLAVALGLLLGTSISATLRKTVKALEGIAAGDMSVKLQVKTKDEFRQVSQALDTVTGTIGALVSEAARLTAAAVEGRLLTRGDPAKFSGGYRDVLMGLNSVMDGLVGFIDNMPNSAMIVNKEYEIQFMNRAAAALGNANAKDVVESRRKCFDFFRTGDCRTQNCACTRALQTNGEAQSETQATPLDKTYDIHYTGVPIHDAEGSIVGAFEVIVDQSAIKTAERKMKKIAAFQDAEIDRLNRNLQKISCGDLSCDFTVAQGDGDTADTAELFVTISEALQQSVKAIEALVADTDLLARAAVEGDLQTRADAEKHLGDFRKIVEGVNHTLDLVIDPINETIAVFKRLAEGDLTASVSGDYKGDFDVLKTSLNESLKAINQTLSQVNIAVDQVAEGSVQVSQASQALSQGASEQASSLEEITSSTTEISSQTKQNTENALRMNTLARSAQDNAGKGNAQMKELVSAMSDINTSAEEIKKVVKTIDDISFQINLLALNANVEAARAGKYGKGFAVVAEEVRNLAVRSAESVKDTTRMVEEAIANIQRGNLLVDSTASQLDQIVEGASQVSQLAEEVATAGREQTQGLEQIALGLNQIDQVTQSNTASAEESASASEELSSQAQQVKAMLSRFKIRLEETDTGNAALLAMLKAELAQRTGGSHAQAAPRIPPKTETPQKTGTTPKSAPQAPAKPLSGKVIASGGRTLNPAEIISLDDDNFGKF